MDLVLFERMRKTSKSTFYELKNNSRGWAPYEAANLLEVARLDWLSDLTELLPFFMDKASNSMTEGELLLGYATLGALIEGWLKLFYCVYYLDYVQHNKATYKNGNLVDPNDLKFEQLKVLSRGILWPQGSDYDTWLEKVQHRRNAIHAFNNRDLGNKAEYLNDIEVYCAFVDEVWSRIPDMP